MKTYQEIRRKHLEDLGKSSFGGMFAFVVVIAVAVIIIVASLINTASMQSVSTENAKDYVSELTIQIAGTVSTDVTDKKTSLSSIAESIRLHNDDGIDETNSDDYMRNHLETLFNQSQFDFLIYQHIDAEVIQFGTLPKDLAETLGSASIVVQEAEEKDECVAYIDGDTVLFAVPVHSKDAVVGTLITGSSTEALSNLMLSHIYEGQSSFCITNRQGKLLIASGDSHLAEVAELLSPDKQNVKDLTRSLESDFNDGTTGVIEIKLSDNNNYLMTYAPIDGEDWMIVTLVPTNVFSKSYTSYMKRALAFTIGTAVIFASLLGLLVVSYRGARQRLEYIAYTDELTGGINGADFEMRYDVLRRRANPLEYSVVFLDINDFKLANELGGFAAGDRLIKHVYNCITKMLDVKQHEFAARIEVDHYLVCLHENTAEGIQTRINQIVALVNAEGQSVTLGLTVTFAPGACIIDNKDLDINEIMQRARIAKRNVTREQRNHCAIYTEQMRHEISQKVQLDYMAEESIKNHEFVVYYQPKVSRTTGAIKGAEALVRWNHPNRGFISPADFIPVLEESGRIQEVDRYVFEEVCRYLSERKERGEVLFPVSVNLSRLHFWKDDLIGEFAATADKYNVDHSLIEFEITETLFMEQEKLDKIKEGIKQMHMQGFTCAMDDFGVGYSSLSLVNEMDIDTLKFDRSFFMHLNEEKSRRVVECLTEMADRLDLGMVAEGIETQEQFDFLATTKADVIQGFYYSRPLSETDFEAWEKSRAQ